MKKLVLILISIFVLTIFTACGTDLKPQKVSPDNKADTTSKTDNKAQEYKEGDTVKIGDAQLILNSGKSVKPGQYDGVPEGKKLIVCNVTIENKGQESLHISTLAQMKLKDSDDYQYTPTIYTKANGSLDGELAKGNKMRGEVAFQVPNKAKKFQFIYDASIFGSGQILINFETK